MADDGQKGTPATPNGGYGAEQIKVLEGLEAVRKRPGMYIGGTSLAALHHLVYEVVDNSIDEAMAGYATTVTVTLQADGSCAVSDDGRGIPVDPVKHDDPTLDGKSAVEVVMTRLHAGGKFGEEGSAYKVSGGLHGVGVSCVNALSEYVECEIHRDGKVYRIEFERGVVTSPIHVVGDLPQDRREKTGTRVVFKPDGQIFEETGFEYDTLARRLRELSFLNPGVAIRLVDERAGEGGGRKSETFQADHGLLEYIEHLMVGKNPVSSPISIKKEVPEEQLICEVALQYHDGYSETLLTFANNINNVDGGTHGQGFKVALTRTVNGYARRAGIIKDKDPVPTGEDLREGLIAIVSVKLPNPTFNNQPKEKLLNPEVESFVAASLSEAMDAWMEEHPAEAKRLCNKGLIAAQAREAARKARELTRRKTALDSGSMPHKLRDCKTKDVNRSELFIVEGDSAGGSATQGRDVETQAILPLKGKILNVEKARIDKMLQHEEIRTLIAALRCGIGPELDIEKLRYGRVIIMTDADVDGSHIRTLILTFLFRQMAELIRRGRVYIAQPPLFQLARGKKAEYVLNERVLTDSLVANGISRASLVVRDLEGLNGDGGESGEARVERRLEGDEAREAVSMLRRLSDLVDVAERRGLRFTDLLESRSRDPEGRGRLPSHMLSGGGERIYAWSEEQALEAASQRGLAVLGEEENGGGASTTRGVVRELHENRELERVFKELEKRGLSIEDYALVQEESVTGEKLPSRYAWELAESASVKGKASAGAEEAERAIAEEAAGAEGASVRAHSGGRVVEAANLSAIVPALVEIGRRGLEVKRFKGLGEMDAEQLWETTMDSETRTLLRVTMEQAAEAETLFTTLMGEQVEPRRRFIEEHALEVKNLDV